MYKLKHLTKNNALMKKKTITRSTSFVKDSITPRDWFKYDMDAHSTLLGALIDTYSTTEIKTLCCNILMFENDYPKVFKIHEYITKEINDAYGQEQNLNSTLSLVLNQYSASIDSNETNSVCTDLDETYDETTYLLDETLLHTHTRDQPNLESYTEPMTQPYIQRGLSNLHKFYVKQRETRMNHDLIIWYIGIDNKFYVDIWHREEWTNDRDCEPFHLTHTKHLPKKEWVKSLLDSSEVHKIMRYMKQ